MRFFPKVSGDDSYCTPSGTTPFKSDTYLLTGNTGSAGYASSYIRFPDVLIPKDANILTAQLRLISPGYTGTSTSNVRIYGNASDNSVAPTDKTSFDALSLTTNYVAWNNIPATDNNPSEYTEPDITAVIQEIVNRGSWVSGNAIGIILKDQSSPGLRYFASFDYTPWMPVIDITWTNEPVAVIQYDSESHPSSYAQNNSWTHTIGAGDDRVAIVFAGCHDGTVAPSTITFNGSAMTQLVDYSGTWRRLAIYYLVNPPVGESTVVVNWGSAPGYEVAITCLSFNGVDQSTVFRNNAGQTGSVGWLSHALTSTAGDLVLGACCYLGGTLSPGTVVDSLYLKTNTNGANTAMCVVSQRGQTGVTNRWNKTTACGDTNYCCYGFSLIPSLAASLNENVTFSETLIGWSNPGRIDEGLTFSDASSGGFEYQDSITEDMNLNDSLSLLYQIIWNENITLADLITIEQLPVITERLTLSDLIVCPYWYETLSEAFNAIDLTEVENKNITWRQEKSLNMVGQHIQLKFYNNTLDQSLYLRDIKMYFDRWEDRKAIEAGDYVGEHVRITFRNNVVDESLYLEYVRIIGIFRGLLGWSV